jgi:hypothetical protein
MVTMGAEDVRGDVFLVDGRVGDEGQIENPRLGSTHLGAA